MKNYRVWEANRKIFLYPENWIEPELRDDKTSFFEELEAELLQNEITDETAERALTAYLEKLDAVAKLEVCGQYHESTDDGHRILHVFARSPGKPHAHYYRRLEVGSRWTPWERIDMDIDGDHLIPVVYNRRLYLFWTTFEEKPEKERGLGGPIIQSLEHWRWVKAHARWRQRHANWVRA